MRGQPRPWRIYLDDTRPEFHAIPTAYASREAAIRAIERDWPEGSTRRYGPYLVRRVGVANIRRLDPIEWIS